MLEYNEILPKKVILLDGEPYEVLDAHVFRKQQRKPVNQTKLRHLITGKVTEQSFHVSEKVEEADLSTKEVKYLYADNKGAKWFCAVANPADRFSLSDELIGTQGQFLKPNAVVEALIFDEKVIGIKMAIKVDLLVKEAPPAVKGDTARGGSKEIILETGAKVQAPLFINEGDIVRINTVDGLYTERVDKK